MPLFSSQYRFPMPKKKVLRRESRPVRNFSCPAHEEALLLNSASSQNIAAQPLHLRAEGLTTTEAIESIQAFTLMHYGSIVPPLLPVTLYRDEEIAATIAKGTLPGGDYGVVPFWL